MAQKSLYNQETLEGKVLEFTGTTNFGDVGPMQFARILASDDTSLEVILESSQSLKVNDTFRAIAYPSPYKPDHSKHYLGSDEPMAPWLQYIEVLPAKQLGARRLIGGDDITRRPFPAAREAGEIISYLEARGMPTAETCGDAIRITIAEDSSMYMRRGRVSLSGPVRNDPRPIRAVLDYARARWGGECAVEGSEDFKAQAWAQANLIGAKISNYEPSSEAEARLRASGSNALFHHIRSFQLPPVGVRCKRPAADGDAAVLMQNRY